MIRNSQSQNGTNFPHQRSTEISVSTNAKNATLCFQSLTHSSQFTIPPIPTTFYALRTLCQKHPGVGVRPYAFSTTSLTPIESYSFAKCLPNSFRSTLFHNYPLGGTLQAIPGVGIKRTVGASAVRHYARRGATLVLPAKSFSGGAR